MGLKVSNLKYKRYKKNIFSDLNFEINSGEFLGIYFENKFLQSYFLNLLLGGKKPTSGTIYLNNNNITPLLQKERKIGYVSPGTLRLGFLPTKLRLAYHILKTPRFLYDASIKYFTNKYNYKNLVFINDDISKQDLILKTDKIVNEYFHNSIKIKKEWMETYLSQMNLFHEKEIKKILNDDFDSMLIQSLHTYAYKKEEIKVHEGFLAFLQALWDKIYYISDLDYLCNCWEIAKKQKLKNKNFGFVGAKLVCEKYLRLLRVEIAYERYKILKARKALKKYRLNVINTIVKNHERKKVIKAVLNKQNSSSLITWTKLADDQWFNYNQKQEQLILNLLPDEATLVKSKVLEYFHKYHLMLLNNKLSEQKIDNSLAIDEANEKVVTVYNQAFEQVKELMSTLNIKMNWFKITKNLSSFDHTKIRLINAILTKKELIVLHNTFDNLTQNEATELGVILNSLKLYNPSLTFLVLTKNIEYIKNYVTQLLLFDTKNNYKLVTKDQAEFLPDTLDLYYKFFNGTDNVFTVKYIQDQNELKDEKLKIILDNENHLIDKKDYTLAISPKLISFVKSKNFNKELNLMFKGQVKYVKKAFKGVSCTFETNTGLVFKMLVNEKELNIKKLTTIYFDKKALLLYDMDTNNLIMNV